MKRDGHSPTLNEHACHTAPEGRPRFGMETWIEWFVSQKGNEFLCIVDSSFIGESRSRLACLRGAAVDP